MKELTGRHVFAIIGGGFAVIIAVNIALAVAAVRTFPGLETANSYVASQVFDAERAAQEGLGWDVDLDYQGGRLTVAIADADGPVHPERVEAVVGRATYTGDDVSPAFAWDGRAFAAPVELEPGRWTVRLTAESAEGVAFRQRLPLRVRK